MKFVLINILFFTLAITAHAGDNPLNGSKFYVNPLFRNDIIQTINSLSSTDPDRDKIIKTLEDTRDTSTAILIADDKSVQLNSTEITGMNGVLIDAETNQKGSRVVFQINNLPSDKCEQGLPKYKEFINNVVAITNAHKDKVPMAFILEQNAIPMMATNPVSPECQAAWKEGLNYVVAELHKAEPQFPIYLGFGHGNWLGTEPNSIKADKIVKSMDVLDKIRGFATNIGNYQPVGQACPKALFCTDPKNQDDQCCINPCPINPQYHDNNEMNYALRMESFFPGKKYVIDTGRNGHSNARITCNTWCNARNVGFGLRPTGDTSSDLIDAYLWINNPGLSAGCTEILPDGNKCDAFNKECASIDSIGTNAGEPRMPAGGQWSNFLVTTLARNANFNNEVIPNDNKGPHITPD